MSAKAQHGVSSTLPTQRTESRAAAALNGQRQAQDAVLLGEKVSRA